MADIRFDTDQNQLTRRQSQKGGLDLIGMVVRMGWAKDRTQASYVLLVVAILAGIIAYVFWPSGTNNTEPVPLPPQISVAQ